MTFLHRQLQRLSTISTTNSSTTTIEDSNSNYPTSPTLRSFPSPTSHFKNSNIDEDDMSSISRPSLYSHQPVPRPAPFEQYYGDHMSQVHLLEELKSNRLEGVYNLSFMLLAFALFYLFVRNVVDNGFLAGPSAICFSILLRDMKMLTLFILPLPLFFTIPFLLVLCHSRSSVSSTTVSVLHHLSLTGLFIVTSLIIFRIQLDPLLGVVAGCVVMILVLKMHSYVMTNLILAEETESIRKSHRKSKRRDSIDSDNQNTSDSDINNNSDYDSNNINNNINNATTTTTTTNVNFNADNKSLRKRRSTRNELNSTEEKNEIVHDDGKEKNNSLGSRQASKEKANERHVKDKIKNNRQQQCLSPGVKYPLNVTIKNIGYFIIAPTLVYETGYPRTKTTRSRYVLWQLLQILICLLVIYVLLMQFCAPVWRTLAPKDRLWWFSIKLALPCFFMWLLLFWSLFHCLLNAIAEMTNFADRQFYLDWWNATDLNQFWRTWNMPVHEWCIRHLYIETVSRQRLNRQAAALGTFLLSAVFHEYVCIVAFRMVRPYMFASMILQVPLVKWSTRFAGTRTGNYFMWIMLFVGQSWVPLLYCRDYLLLYDTLMCKPLYSRQ